jgi:hypothetical protein
VIIVCDRSTVSPVQSFDDQNYHWNSIFELCCDQKYLLHLVERDNALYTQNTSPGWHVVLMSNEHWNCPDWQVCWGKIGVFLQTASKRKKNSHVHDYKCILLPVAVAFIVGAKKQPCISKWRDCSVYYSHSIQIRITEAFQDQWRSFCECSYAAHLLICPMSMRFQKTESVLANNLSFWWNDSRCGGNRFPQWKSWDIRKK